MIKSFSSLRSATKPIIPLIINQTTAIDTSSFLKIPCPHIKKPAVSGPGGSLYPHSILHLLKRQVLPFSVCLHYSTSEINKGPRIDFFHERTKKLVVKEPNYTRWTPIIA